MTIEDLEARIAVLEAERDAANAERARQAAEAAEWMALPLEERVRKIENRAATTPDGIYYLTDYQQPADTPAYSLVSANSVQAAINTRVKKSGDVMTGQLDLQAGGGALSLHQPGVSQVIIGTRLDGGAMKAHVINQTGSAFAAIMIADGVGPYDAVTVAQLSAFRPPNMAQAIPASTYVGDGQISATSIVVPTLGPGAEITLGPFGINPGTYAVCGTQHPSTWVYSTYDDRGDGTAVVRVRNGTASTTHTNIRVHVFFLNLPS